MKREEMNVKWDKNLNITIPEVGDVWSHIRGRTVYIRVDDEARMALPEHFRDTKKYFYSIKLSEPTDGKVIAVPYADSYSIIILNHTLTIHE